MATVQDWLGGGMPTPITNTSPSVGGLANILGTNAFVQDAYTGFGDDWGTSPELLSTFAGSPAALWQAARINQMGQLAAIPQFQRTAMQGFTPALGAYMLQGNTGPFAQYLSGTRPDANTLDQGWQQAVTASRMLNPNYSVETNTPMTAGMLAQQGYLTGENARRNALAMSAARLGGGVGYGAQARQAALGNLYDLYAARAAAAGTPVGGFLGYLGGRLGQ
jgi:hypothetical protein